MTTEVEHSTRNIRLEKIRPSPYQPREGKDDETIEELVESMRTQGLLQPVAVRLVDGKKGEYECVFGHRRIEAAARLHWKEIPALLLEITPQESADRLLEENLRRLDLTATAKARFLQRYIADFGLTQEQVGERFGMAQETVSNYLRTLNVPEEVAALVDEGRLTISHVKELLPLSDHPEAMVKRAQAAAAPKGKPATTHATPVRELASSVGGDRQDIRAREAKKSVRVKAKTSKEPALAKRLLAGLTPTDDKAVPYTDPESGLPLLFARVIVDNLTLRPCKPTFAQKDYNPQSDSELVKAVEKLGLVLGYSGTKAAFTHQDQHGRQYHLSASLRHKAGKKYTGPCPCGGEHVAVRGWGVEKGDPGQPTDYYHRDTDTKGAPKTVIYCADPKAVNIVLAGLVKKGAEAEQERKRQEGLSLEAFLQDVAPQGGAPVAAFLIGCVTGELPTAEKALTFPGEAWVEVCKHLVDELTGWRRTNGNPGIQQLVAVVTGEAKAPAPKAKPKRGKKVEAGNP